MAAAALPLPRKISQAPKTLTDSLKGALVNPVCCDIWQTGRTKGRADTFIGLINSTDWRFYLAPCFGVDAGIVTGSVKEIADKIAAGDFPDDTDVKANSTSSSDATIVTIKKSALEAVYGKGSICYTELDPVKGFDGKSHQAMHRWVMLHAGTLKSGGSFWNKALGFAIQKDKAGYYIRFASTLNLHPGQNGGGGTTFAKKQVMEQIYFLGCIKWGTKMVDDTRPSNREPRDLPTEWADFVEKVLARDLELALLGSERIKSRGEGQFSLLTRFETKNRLV